MKKTTTLFLLCCFSLLSFSSCTERFYSSKWNATKRVVNISTAGLSGPVYATDADMELKKVRRGNTPPTNDTTFLLSTGLKYRIVDERNGLYLIKMIPRVGYVTSNTPVPGVNPAAIAASGAAAAVATAAGASAAAALAAGNAAAAATNAGASTAAVTAAGVAAAAAITAGNSVQAAAAAGIAATAAITAGNNASAAAAAGAAAAVAITNGASANAAAAAGNAAASAISAGQPPAAAAAAGVAAAAIIASASGSTSSSGSGPDARIFRTDSDASSTLELLDGNTVFVVKAEDLHDYNKVLVAQITFGTMILPLKWRGPRTFKDVSYERHFATDVSVGPSVGYRFKLKGNNYRTFSTIAAFAGPTLIDFVSTTNQTGSTTNANPENMFAFTAGIGYVHEISGFQIGVIYGADYVSGNRVKEWPYDGKGWVSFAIGYNFLSSNTR